MELENGDTVHVSALLDSVGMVFLLVCAAAEAEEAGK